MSMEIIRQVEMQPLRDGAVYRLTLWDTGRQDWRGQSKLGYRFERCGDDADGGVDGWIIFEGEDFAGSPMHADDSDETLAALLGFLTLRKGDTDAEYFENYTETQLAWAQSYDAEVLGSYALEEGAEPIWQDVDADSGN
jgi:hypothetical protein